MLERALYKGENTNVSARFVLTANVPEYPESTGAGAVRHLPGKRESGREKGEKSSA